jgi:hypothetical protein
LNWCKIIFSLILGAFLSEDLKAQQPSVTSHARAAQGLSTGSRSSISKIENQGLVLISDDFTRFVSPRSDNARLLMSMSDSLFAKTLLDLGYRSSERGIANEYLISSSKKMGHFRMIAREGKELVMTFSPSYPWLEELVKKQSGMTYRIEEDTEEYVGRTWAIKVLVLKYDLQADSEKK